MPPGVYLHKSRPVAERFWEKVKFVWTYDACWEWQAYRTPYGYGQFAVRVEGVWLAPRLAYKLVYGEFDLRLHVLHRCDNPACVRPHHLFLGTQQDNLKDMRSKGRHVRGEMQPRAKLTEIAVRDIRASNESSRMLANRYGVNTEAINRVKKRLRWAHVKEEPQC